jgi:hypothetical protein
MIDVNHRRRLVALPQWLAGFFGVVEPPDGFFRFEQSITPPPPRS